MTLLAVLSTLFAGGFAVAARGHSADVSPLIVPDQSIGGIAIDMLQSDVTALYGQPDDFVPITLPNGVGVLVRYQVAGGELIVVYAEGRVVSVETTSSLHRTAAGAGPGAPVSTLSGLSEDFCTGGRWDGASATSPDSVVTVFERNGDEIGNVIVTTLAYYDLCASTGPNQEVPEPAAATYPLAVQIVPGGGGWVRSYPYEIDCPNACSGSFDDGATVSLEVHTTSGFTFAGWGGACSGTSACVLRMDRPRMVVARFSGRYVPPPPAPPPHPRTTTTATTSTTTGSDR